ncbi:hypothetical protein ALT_1111 [Aspergillus lentulus]|uniref:Uncharacterized protein n=1 Tax=Aspergillus lentulus TaxID=293939 RepID=A0AAN4PBX1_ASPLE|nr:hypothetical protein CNMCM6069_009177 [Aspergillus lentulus]KAF4167541.1 hypothetical protein CNMCM6936_004805 [Aspergillus lentulus]KAF4179799.1 hypothetical protein CNMCM8060_002522 [Aspergillus lentulus]KAF4185538.1 hypothetical protein CNMCM7927_006482 [Aspergillus lentulus]KAF4194980.1 hypothetical protein CNMCM8694_006993 [Aspergillus lentulus]
MDGSVRKGSLRSYSASQEHHRNSKSQAMPDPDHIPMLKFRTLAFDTTLVESQQQARADVKPAQEQFEYINWHSGSVIVTSCGPPQLC